MKIIRRQLTAAMIAALALAHAVPAVAQTSQTHTQGGSRLDFLAGYLSLTDAQKTQAQTIFTAAETASTTARGQLTAAQDAVRAAIKANASDNEIDRLSAAVGTIHGQLTAIQAKAEAKFYALLTADQKTKYDALGSRGGGGGIGPRFSRGLRQ